jgi:hypothetical protein
VLKKLIISGLCSFAVAATYVLWRGTPTTLATPEIAPNTIKANEPTLVTVTVRIHDPAFTVHSVDLVRVDAHAVALPETEMLDEDGTNTDAVPDHQFFLRMRDDGTKGDVVADDGVFTRRVLLKESSGPVYFQILASFAKVERPVRSAPFAVNVAR